MVQEYVKKDRFVHSLGGGALYKYIGKGTKLKCKYMDFSLLSSCF